MLLLRQQPFAEIETLRRQMNQRFHNLATISNTDNQTITWTPAVELRNTQDNLIIKAEIPGVESKDLDVHVTRDAVIISGEHRFEKKQQTNGFFRTEFRYGKFQRIINLPVAIQNDQVQANFSNGILSLTLPKLNAVKNQVVKVNITEATNSKANLTAAEEKVNQEIPTTEINTAEEVVKNEVTTSNNVVDTETDNDPWELPNPELATV